MINHSTLGLLLIRSPKFSRDFGFYGFAAEQNLGKRFSMSSINYGAVYISVKSKFLSTLQIARIAVTSFKLRESRGIRETNFLKENNIRSKTLLTYFSIRSLIVWVAFVKVPQKWS